MSQAGGPQRPQPPVQRRSTVIQRDRPLSRLPTTRCHSRHRRMAPRRGLRLPVASRERATNRFGSHQPNCPLRKPNSCLSPTSLLSLPKMMRCLLTVPRLTRPGRISERQRPHRNLNHWVTISLSHRQLRRPMRRFSGQPLRLQNHSPNQQQSVAIFLLRCPQHQRRPHSLPLLHQGKSPPPEAASRPPTSPRAAPHRRVSGQRLQPR